MRNINEYEPYLAMLDFSADIGPIEAERRAEKCFMVQSWLIKDLHEAEYGEIIFNDNVEMEESSLLLQGPEEISNAPARKAWVHTRPKRRDVFEKYANAKANVERLKRMLKLFDQAQIYFAQKAKR